MQSFQLQLKQEGGLLIHFMLESAFQVRRQDVQLRIQDCESIWEYFSFVSLVQSVDRHSAPIKPPSSSPVAGRHTPLSPSSRFAFTATRHHYRMNSSQLSCIRSVRMWEVSTCSCARTALRITVPSEYDAIHVYLGELEIQCISTPQTYAGWEFRREDEISVFFFLSEGESLI